MMTSAYFCDVIKLVTLIFLSKGVLLTIFREKWAEKSLKGGQTGAKLMGVNLPPPLVKYESRAHPSGIGLTSFLAM